MTEKKKQNKPRINPYRLYGMVIVLLLSISFFGDSGMQSTGKTNTSEFERYLNNEDIEKVVIQNEKIARIFLKREALDKSEHQALKEENFLGQSLDVRHAFVYIFLSHYLTIVIHLQSI